MYTYKRYLRKYRRLWIRGKKTKKPRAKYKVRARPLLRTQRQIALGVIFITVLGGLIFIINTAVPYFSVMIDVKNIQSFKIPPKEIEYIYEICAEQNQDPVKALTTYCIYNKFFKEKRIAYTKEQIQANFFPKIEKIQSSVSEKRFNRYCYIVDTVMSEIKAFPINLAESYMFGDTWDTKSKMCEGQRHTGTDLFDRENIKGRLPVVSMTGGIVEEVGRSGAVGWHVGIRTEKGAYYFYDHLDRLEGIEIGTPVAPGFVLGCMGGDKESPANVHIGIKINSDLKKGGVWMNPYPFLRYFETAQESHISEH